MPSQNNKKEHDSQTETEIVLRLLATLDEKADVLQRCLAAVLRVSLISINYCLKSLKAKGSVKAENFSKSNNKLGCVYLLTVSGVVAKSRLTAAFLNRKCAWYRRSAQEIAHLEAQMRHYQAERK